MSNRLRVAAIVTIYHPKAHADVIVTKYLKGMSTDEGFLPPEIDIVAMYLDHALENDIGLGLAEEYGLPVYPSIRRALHAGDNKLKCRCRLARRRAWRLPLERARPPHVPAPLFLRTNRRRLRRKRPLGPGLQRQALRL